MAGLDDMDEFDGEEEEDIDEEDMEDYDEVNTLCRFSTKSILIISL